MTEPTTIQKISSWGQGLSWEGIPESVRELGRAQRRSVLAAMAASVADGAAQRVLEAVGKWAGPGHAPLIGTGRRVAVPEALYSASALSIALDFDDYLCFGHTGHSAVLVPLMMAATVDVSGDEQLVAQIIANEVGARLGGACLIGPLNGQMWSFIHAGAAAVAAARVLKLDPEQSAHALAIALYQAPRPTVPGFMAPDSKLLTAAEPTLVGVRAAKLAAAGVTGPLDGLDHPQGFLSAFSYAPIRGIFSGLGEGWATQTLSIKPYPGCAYVDTIVDALLTVDLPPAEDVEAVDIDASILTCGMNGMSEHYTAGTAPTPVTVNFSVPYNVAIVLVAGRLTPDETHDSWLSQNEKRLAEVARRVHLTHDRAFTDQSIASFAPVLPPRFVRNDIAGENPLRALAQLRREHRTVQLGAGEIAALTWNLAGESRKVGEGPPWSPEALDAFTMTFPARVRIRTKSGHDLEATVEHPRGGAGHPTDGPTTVSQQKLAAWGPKAYSDVSAIEDAITQDAEHLVSLLG